MFFLLDHNLFVQFHLELIDLVVVEVSDHQIHLIDVSLISDCSLVPVVQIGLLYLTVVIVGF